MHSCDLGILRRYHTWTHTHANLPSPHFKPQTHVSIIIPHFHSLSFQIALSIEVEAHLTTNSRPEIICPPVASLSYWRVQTLISGDVHVGEKDGLSLMPILMCSTYNFHAQTHVRTASVVYGGRWCASCIFLSNIKSEIRHLKRWASCLE